MLERLVWAAGAIMLTMALAVVVAVAANSSDETEAVAAVASPAPRPTTRPSPGPTPTAPNELGPTVDPRDPDLADMVDSLITLPAPSNAAVGTCWRVIGGQLIWEVVSCGEPHEVEVYAEVNVSSIGEYDLNEILDVAFPEDIEADPCLIPFAEFVGEEYSKSLVFIATSIPSEAEWAGGRTSFNCLLYVPDSLITGSLDGSGL